MEMADVFFQSTLKPSEKRMDLLTEAIVNSAIDMEATLGSVYAIAYMLRHNIDIELAMRVVLKQNDRRITGYGHISLITDWHRPSPKKNLT